MSIQDIDLENTAGIMIDEDLKQSFKIVVEECIEKGMFVEFCRLHGYSIPTKTIDIMIDDATGRTSKIGYEFFDFVSEYVFKPLMIKCLKEQVKNEN